MKKFDHCTQACHAPSIPRPRILTDTLHISPTPTVNAHLSIPCTVRDGKGILAKINFNRSWARLHTQVTVNTSPTLSCTTVGKYNISKLNFVAFPYNKSTETRPIKRQYKRIVQ